MSKFDSTSDIPWSNLDLILILDKTFPDSKFIHLDRDDKSWLKSFITFRKKYTDDIRPEEHLDDFRKHNKYIAEYFKNFPESRFISLSLSDSDVKIKLEKFLEVKLP